MKHKRIFSILLSALMVLSSFSTLIAVNTQEASAAKSSKITKVSSKYYSGDNGTKIYEFEGINGKGFCAHYQRHNADKSSKGTIKNITNSTKSSYKKIVRIMYWTAYKKQGTYSSPKSNADKKKLLTLHYCLCYLYSNLKQIKGWDYWDKWKSDNRLFSIEALIDDYGDKAIPAEDKANFRVYVWTDGNNKYQPLIGWSYNEPEPEMPSLTVNKVVINDATGEKSDPSGFRFILDGPGGYKETRVSDDQGEASFEELEAGEYTLTEELTDEQIDAGYKAMDPNPAKITIGKSDEEIEYTATNHIDSPLSLKLIKRMADGSSPAGFTFHIKGVDPDGNTVFEDDRTTGSNGVILISDISPGTYTATEALTPEQKEKWIPDPASQTVTIGSDDTGTISFPEVFYNAPPDDRKRLRGRVEIFLTKKDKETDSEVPIGTASLAGALFEVRYYDNQIGKTSDDPERTWKFRTDDSGKIYLNTENGDIDRYYAGGDPLFTEQNEGKTVHILPLGTYQIKELQAPEGYVADPDTHVIILDGNELSETATDEWDLVSEERKTFRDQVKRCDVHFEKQDENHQPLPGIPFVIENLDTGEKVYVITDENGIYDSAYIPHTQNTNAYNSLAEYDASGTKIPQSVIDSLSADPSGTWFGKTANGDPVPPDDSVGALHWGRYTLRELRCDTNENRNLIDERRFDIRVHDKNLDLGTIIEANIEIKTEARDFDSNNHTGTVSDNAKIIDTVQYWTLETKKKYRLRAELHWAKGVEGSRIDGGIVKDANGVEIAAEKEFSPTQPDSTIDVTIGKFDSTRLMAGSTELKGEETVVYEYLYDITDGSETIVAQHTDPDDSKQIISYPWISTTLTDNETGIRMGFAREDMKLTDRITYRNFRRNQEYHIQGILYDAETGLAVERADGEKVMTDEWYTATDTDGVFDITYRLDSSDMAGKTLVSLVTLSAGSASTIYHRDKQDEKQTLHIPKITTEAKDQDTGDEVGKIIGTFTDVIRYENMLPDLNYRMDMEIMNKENGKSTGLKASKDFHTVANADDNNRSDGEVVVRQDLNGAYMKDELEGRSLVAFEECFVKGSDSGEPASDAKVAEHRDIEDEAQTVHYPMIRTNARDGMTDDHVGTVTSDGIVKDNVECWNLVPGKEYVLEAEYRETEDLSVLATGTMSFTAENPHELHEVLLELNTLDLDGKTAVIYEKLYHNGIEVDQHEDREDENQRVHYPKIRTEASDSRTNDHVGSVFGKLINGFRRLIGQDTVDEELAGITDTVSYHNTLPDMEYTLRGTLRYKEDHTDPDGTVHNAGDAITDEEGKPISAEAVLEAGKHDADGKAELHFDIDTSGLEDVTIVCFEKMFHNNSLTGDAVEVTRHEDLGDEEQSVHEAKIRTHAVDMHIASDGFDADKSTEGTHYDWHTGDASGNTVVRDDVTLGNLVNGMTYTLKGTLHYKDTGEAVTDADGTPYSRTVTFTLQEDTDDKRVDTVVPIEFNVDGKYLEGRTVVAFEELYHNDVSISVHADISDEEQSVYYPWIRTKAEDNKTGAKETQISDHTEIKDTVSYRNLLPGKYAIEGVLMDKSSDGGELRDQNGDLITASDTFEISSAEEGKEGSRELVFALDSSLLKDRIMVAFEDLYLLDENDPEYKVLIASHADLSDDEQSEWMVDISTELTDVKSSSHKSAESKAAAWNDHVEYWGLIPGKEYTMKGVLMVKAPGSDGLKASRFVDVDGRHSESEVTFVPEKSCGAIDLRFKANTSGLEGKTVVAYERLYPSDLPDTVIASHEDIKDKAQSVRIIRGDTDKHGPKTGESRLIIYCLIAFLASLFLLICAVLRKRTKSKK